MPSLPLASLKVVLGGTPDQQFQLDAERVVIGRSPNCEIVLGFSAISGRHAQISHVDGDYFLEDLNSRNGTYVNGQRLQGRHRLRNRDRLDICDVVMTFHREQPAGKLKLLVEDQLLEGSLITSTIDVSSSDSHMRSGLRAEEKLRAIIEIVDKLGSTLALRDVLPKILESLFGIFTHADHGFVLLMEGVEPSLVPKAALRRGVSEESEEIRTSLSVVRKALESRQAILSEDASSDSRFDPTGSVADLHIRSLMCAPLIGTQGRILGAMQLETRSAAKLFNGDDLDVLASIARLTAFAVENAQLHELLLEQQATERDLALAREVQRGFLPNTRPTAEGYEFFDYYEPARQVGGDYYDYIRLPGERLAVIVADVSGKGVPAALLMARLCTEARYSLVSERRPSSAICRLNASFMEHGREDHIVTLVLLVLDLRGHTATVVIAGHMAPILVRSGQQLQLVGDEVRSLPIGVDPRQKYRQSTLRLMPGDALAMFTDGLTDARNEDDELYGQTRLSEQMQKGSSGASDLGRKILTDVRRFIGPRRLTDDLCLVCVGRV